MPCSVNCDNWLDERDVVRQSRAAAVLINANLKKQNKKENDMGKTRK